MSKRNPREDQEQTKRLVELADKAGIYYTIHLDENLNIADLKKSVDWLYSQELSNIL